MALSLAGDFEWKRPFDRDLPFFYNPNPPTPTVEEIFQTVAQAVKDEFARERMMRDYERLTQVWDRKYGTK